jgi:cardiolipin synthase
MNIPNLLSLSRIFLIPVFLYLLFLPEVKMKIWGLVVFGIASFTDLLDGWSARKLGMESELGKFLDPLADKFLVIATLIAFVILDALIPLWMVMVIVGRDIMITLIRYLAIKEGRSIRTSQFGKVKTFFQMCSIVIIIMLFIYRAFGLNLNHGFDTDSVIKIYAVFKITMSDHPNKWVIVAPYWLMLIITIMTAWSGIRYLLFNGRILIPPYKKR